MEKIIIFGGTGFIGLSLAEHLSSNGFQPILIARNKPKEKLPFEFIKWDATIVGDWVKTLEDAKAVVNLCGRTVNCIKTPENCDVILRSRVDSTKTIGQALKALKKLPEVWVQMSTAHIYGDPPKQLCTETSTTGYGLAPTVGQAWEKGFLTVIPKEMRGVRLRTSFVIGKGGGALKSLKNIVKLGLGGKVGHGNQGMSWIHEYDMNEIVLQAIVNTKFDGFYIASSPNPVSNKEFMKLLKKQVKIPIGLSAPKFMIRFGAKYIFKTDPDLILYGRYVYSKKLKEEGFSFKFPNLNDALNNLINN